MKHGFQLAHEYDPALVPRTDAVVEIKYDGMMALSENGRLYNRRGADVTDRFPSITPRRTRSSSARSVSSATA